MANEDKKDFNAMLNDYMLMKTRNRAANRELSILKSALS